MADDVRGVPILVITTSGLDVVGTRNVPRDGGGYKGPGRRARGEEGLEWEKQYDQKIESVD
ncbi:hypothetical protein JCM14635_00980 [Megalodesulfovibrio paquesii]